MKRPFETVVNLELKDKSITNVFIYVPNRFASSNNGWYVSRKVFETLAKDNAIYNDICNIYVSQNVFNEKQNTLCLEVLFGSPLMMETYRLRTIKLKGVC